MNPSHGYSEGAEVPENNKKIRIVAKALIEARNEAIDECIALIGQQSTINYQTWPEVKRKLESLKNKPI